MPYYGGSRSRTLYNGPADPNWQIDQLDRIAQSLRLIMDARQKQKDRQQAMKDREITNAATMAAKMKDPNQQAALYDQLDTKYPNQGFNTLAAQARDQYNAIDVPKKAYNSLYSDAQDKLAKDYQSMQDAQAMPDTLSASTVFAPLVAAGYMPPDVQVPNTGKQDLIGQLQQRLNPVAALSYAAAQRSPQERQLASVGLSLQPQHLMDQKTREAYDQAITFGQPVTLAPVFTLQDLEKLPDTPVKAQGMANAIMHSGNVVDPVLIQKLQEVAATGKTQGELQSAQDQAGAIRQAQYNVDKDKITYEKRLTLSNEMAVEAKRHADALEMLKARTQAGQDTPVSLDPKAEQAMALLYKQGALGDQKDANGNPIPFPQARDAYIQKAVQDAQAAHDAQNPDGSLPPLNSKFLSKSIGAQIIGQAAMFDKPLTVKDVAKNAAEDFATWSRGTEASSLTGDELVQKKKEMIDKAVADFQAKQGQTPPPDPGKAATAAGAGTAADATAKAQSDAAAKAQADAAARIKALTGGATSAYPSREEQDKFLGNVNPNMILGGPTEPQSGKTSQMSPFGDFMGLSPDLDNALSMVPPDPQKVAVLNQNLPFLINKYGPSGVAYHIADALGASGINAPAPPQTDVGTNAPSPLMPPTPDMSSPDTASA
jgi:hypothetical protein